ncbi:hypothetical protein GQ42DRAFT_161272 [Ramicandelaber brevisporus]|nr:hypothetical protein GQ42DRAFT_161272 [Ramicandelaber brevisporus]
MSADQPPRFVFKILEASPDLALAVQPLNAMDTRDGFIHMSTAPQTLATCNRHFAQFQEVHVARIEFSRLPAEKVKWELAPKVGEFFPHLYDEMKTEYYESVEVGRKVGENFVFPEGFLI